VQQATSKNTLFHGDNLAILHHHIAAESIDLIYLDPPFNSKRNYNILCKGENRQDACSTLKAFEDTWPWSYEIEAQYQALTARGAKVGTVLETLVGIMGRKQMTAYLVMMAIRLVELHRVLRPTGSLYLHCDTTSSHYLKLILDLIFGEERFQNELIWKRTHAHNDPQRFGHNTDRLLFYTKSTTFTFNPIFLPYTAKYLKAFFHNQDAKGRYRLVVLTAPGTSGGAADNEWKGYRPSKSGQGRHWSIPKRIIHTLVGAERAKILSIVEKLNLLEQHGYLVFSKNGVPSFKQYLHEMEGMPAQELWDDITPIASQAKERLGYPTQKPLALLERIIQASSNPGDVVLDPFCGCGTTLHAAQQLGRAWIGIEKLPLAIELIKSRLYARFKLEAEKDYDFLV
jgi:site-specific DNA-methyltransferase (adenine-specific)